MEKFEHLYDEREEVTVRYVGFSTGTMRYDFSIVYTNMFFGKTLVIDMQTGRSTLLSDRDIDDGEHLRQVFNVSNEEEAKELSDYLRELLPGSPRETQY